MRNDQLAPRELDTRPLPQWLAGSSTLRVVWQSWRVSACVVVAVAGMAALVSAWLTPDGPVTTGQALASMVIGAFVGVAAGMLTRSRWSMLVAPLIFVVMFELATSSFDTDGAAAFMVSRGFFGLIVLSPMLLGATFGSALTRRLLSGSCIRTGWGRVGLYARRTVAGVTTLGMVILGLEIARPAPIKAFHNEKGSRMAGSLSEKTRVDINGFEQGMFIKSKDTRNPVLLFVHGGPGMPMYWLTQRFPTGLENHFTMVWWEQRGAGLSFDPDIPSNTMTADQFVADTLAVTRYLLERFDTPKIYLMGHSWGSYIGIQAVAKAPELYAAYIGVGQLSYQLESEQLAYEYALSYYEGIGDARMVRKLKGAPPGTTVPLPAKYDALRDEYMHRAGIGTMREMKSVISGLFLPSWRSREYTFMEKVNLWRGKIYSKQSKFGLWDTMLATDVRKKVPALQIPVYFFHGKHDYTCAYPLAKGYLEQLQAPIKGFYTFEDSAHSPMFEEPERTVAIMLTDVLHASVSLADD